jgi:Spy/CpxP family protein refolding chaperone
MMPPGGGFMAGREPAMESKGHEGWEHGDMMGEKLFCPEMVMRYQKDLDLTADQVSAIKKEAVYLAAHVTDLRWQLSSEKVVLEDLLKPAKLDEKAVLAEKEKILKMEDDLKLTHLTALVRIKNALTSKQQDKLIELQKHNEHHRWGQWGQPMMRHEMMGSFGGQVPPAKPESPPNPQ